MIESKSSRLILKIGGGILVGIGLGFMVFFGLGLGTNWFASGSGHMEPDNTLKVGASAPDFQLTDLSGDKVRLSDFQGKVVLINFWATWCAPCQVEMPILQTYSQRYKNDLVLLAVNAEESKDKVEGFVKKLGLTFDVLLDPEGEVQRLYLLRGYPTSFFVDRNGTLQVQHIGTLTEKQLDDYLSQVGIPR
jgi:thiol-disulfide isomerase/thioredoxin